jgi:hypothetical protein
MLWGRIISRWRTSDGIRRTPWTIRANRTGPHRNGKFRGLGASGKNFRNGCMAMYAKEFCIADELPRLGEVEWSQQQSNESGGRINYHFVHDYIEQRITAPLNTNTKLWMTSIIETHSRLRSHWSESNKDGLLRIDLHGNGAEKTTSKNAHKQHGDTWLSRFLVAGQILIDRCFLGLGGNVKAVRVLHTSLVYGAIPSPSSFFPVEILWTDQQGTPTVATMGLKIGSNGVSHHQLSIQTHSFWCGCDRPWRKNLSGGIHNTAGMFQSARRRLHRQMK